MFSVTPADNVEGDLYVVLRGEECDAAELTGPQPTGLRYCMNSAALRFIPKGDMAAAGYGDYIDMIAPPIS